MMTVKYHYHPIQVRGTTLSKSLTSGVRVSSISNSVHSMFPSFVALLRLIINAQTT